MKIKNHNILLSLILLLVLLLGLSTINAADTTTNINKIEQSTTIMPENSMTEPDDNIKTDILEKQRIKILLKKLNKTMKNKTLKL